LTGSGLAGAQWAVFGPIDHEVALADRWMTALANGLIISTNWIDVDVAKNNPGASPL
jgi:hypothetical protein